MSFWKKKKKENAPVANQKNNKPINNSSPLLNERKVVNQQESGFDVNPTFFDYEKVKLNKFLTDSNEYNTKKLIDDMPNGDYRYTQVSKDFVEINERREKDNKAFDKIFSNLETGINQANFNFEHTKTKSLMNASYLDNENIRHPIDTVVVNNNFIQEVGQKINQDAYEIGQKTQALLKEMQTKILDLNELNEPLINKGTDYGMGGSQTTDSYLMDNIKINKYDDMRQAFENDKFIANQKPIVSPNDFANLNQLSSSTNTRTYIPTKSLNSNNFTKPLGSINNNPYNNNGINNKTMNLNFFDTDIREQEDKSNEVLNQAKTIDQIVVREIQKEVNKYEENKNKMTTQLTSILNKANDEENIFNFDSLVPINEIKTDLRVKKSDKKIYVFNEKGHF